MLLRKRVDQFLAIVGMVAWASAADAQPLAPRDFGIRRWTTDDGLPQNRISCLAQTPDGYLWVGTWFGLVRCDGARFVLFNRYNTSALVDDTISALAVTPDGSLWIGTHDGLVQYRGGKWTRYDAKSGFHEQSVWELAVDGKGKLWVRGEHVGAFPAGPFIDFPAQSPAHALMVLPNGEAAVAGPNGTVSLTGAEAGANPYQRGRALNLEMRLGIPPPDYMAGTPARLVVGDGKGWMLCASATGVAEAVQNGREGWCNLVWEGTDSNAFPELLCRQKGGTVWMALATRGLYRFYGGFERIELLEQERQPTITALLDDREGSLWVGTTAGLFQVRTRGITRITQADGLPDDEIGTVTEGAKKIMWASSAAGLACIGRWRVSPAPALDGLPARRCVVADSAGNLWMDDFYAGTPGLRQYKPDGSQRLFELGEAVQALYLDRKGRLWIGTSQGVRCYRNGILTPLPGLPSVEIRFSLESSDGSMWFGSRSNGLYHWRNGALEHFTTADGLADNFVIALHEDAEGELWIGTANGLNRLVLRETRPGEPLQGVDKGSKVVNARPQSSQRQFFTYTTAHGLLDNCFNSILEDDDGFLWLSCNRGIFRIARSELDSVANGEKFEVVCAVFGTADGMASSETNGEHQPAGCKGDDGRLWFPTAMGIAVIDPKRVSTNEVAPGVIIEEVVADGNSVFGPNAPQANGPDAKVILAPGQGRTLAIQYTATSFVAPEKMRFKYLLEGHDAGWRTVSARERVAFYTDLRPGHYVFRVQACNNHGVWNKTGASFPFSLEPKFTQRAWFPALCAVALLATSGAFGWWRLQWQRRILSAEQFASLERERARIARDLHDDLGSALTGLALEADVARRKHASGERPALDRISATSRALADRMREVVWAINPRCDNVDNLAGFFGQYAEDFLGAAGVICRLDLPAEIEGVSLGAEARHQLFAAFKEALHNVVKHARCSEVEIRIRVIAEALHIGIKDDGRGFGAEDDLANGNGLRNMRERLANIGGEARVEEPGTKGARVTLIIPLAVRSSDPSR